MADRSDPTRCPYGLIAGAKHLRDQWIDEARSTRCSARRRAKRVSDAVGADAILRRYRLDIGSQEASTRPPKRTNRRGVTSTFVIDRRDAEISTGLQQTQGEVIKDHHSESPKSIFQNIANYLM